MAALSRRSLSSISRLSRSVAFAAAVLVVPAFGPILSVSAQTSTEAVQPDVENGKFQFEGVLTRPEFVRSLPGDNFYPTTKLDAGAKVIVVGSKNNWLKILPPGGSFSYVQKAFVQVHGDGKQGKATSQLIVRAGSSLQPVMWVTQAKLEKGEPVEIIGEEEQYFKIKPPIGAYLYVATDAVKPGQQVVVTATGQVQPVAPVAIAEATPAAAPEKAAPEAVPAPAAPTPETPAVLIPKSEQAVVPPDASVPAAPATRPTLTADAEPKLIEPVPAEAVPTEPAPRPVNPLAAARPLSPAEAIAKLQSLEQEFTAASQLPLTEQPLAELTAGYEQVAGADGTTEMTRRIAEARLQTLKVRSESREQLLTVQASRKDAGGKLQAQQAEQVEIRDRIRQSEVRSYTAVGTIRPSSLQVARTPIFRLTDPQTGRTLAYVWATDTKIAGGDGQFVGVRGEIKTDPRFNFKVITPSSVEIIDARGLYTAYAAEIAPPSLLPKSTATISPEQ
ncbi:SH3 domain-containing protein [Humisphaera borealis]|uniref:SH3 domain-containing protein n=1 Tax=Humisphaera borealis TaxID=2807512 RepID=A0A7M2X4Z0_9BACT|nr:SH3 domain-containing protein [Humisphaera borealis]QOV91860.1 hypothetical protein IPV69_11100 [Humisphaera borealis]